MKLGLVLHQFQVKSVWRWPAKAFMLHLLPDPPPTITSVPILTLVTNFTLVT